MLSCLQDYRHELKSQECHEAVHRTLARAAGDVRFEGRFPDALPPRLRPLLRQRAACALFRLLLLQSLAAAVLGWALCS